MCLNPRQVARSDVYGSWHVVTVSCGKCWECVRKRQNEMAALVVRESEFRGSLVHCTFSYAPSKLPMYYVRRFYDAESLEPAGVSALQRICASTELFTSQYADILLSRSDKLFLRQVRAPRRKKLRESIISLQHLTKTEQERADILKCKRSTLQLREDLIRADYIRLYGRSECRKPLLVDSRYSDDGKFVVDTEVFPSLCRRDISLYLKKRRIRYEREFGKKLPTFTYNVIGEYGPKHGRPHFHMAINGLSVSDCAWLVKEWNDFVGNVKCKRVYRYKKGVSGHDGFEAAGKYIGKYLAKGQEFEEPNVVHGFVERPRRCCSANYGVGDLSALRQYLLCYDLFGEYDVSRPRTYPKDKSALVDWVLSRMYLTINGHKYPIPKRIKSLVYNEPSSRFSRKITRTKRRFISSVSEPSPGTVIFALSDHPTEHLQVVQRSSFLSRLVSTRVQEDALRDYSAKLRAFVGKPLEETAHFERLAFEDSLRLAALQRSNTLAKAQHEFLKKSAF